LRRLEIVHCGPVRRLPGRPAYSTWSPWCSRTQVASQPMRARDITPTPRPWPGRTCSGVRWKHR